MTPNKSDSGELRKKIGVYTQAVFWHSIALSHGKTHQEAADAIFDLVTAHIQAIEKAYGGCHNCYGKGYASYQGEWKARGARWSDDSMKFCDCERGQQLRHRLAQYLGENK